MAKVNKDKLLVARGKLNRGKITLSYVSCKGLLSNSVDVIFMGLAASFGTRARGRPGVIGRNSAGAHRIAQGLPWCVCMALSGAGSLFSGVSVKRFHHDGPS